MSGQRERSDDELAQTATAPGSSDPLVREAVPLGEQLGRYKIQRELGRGGMGVVYAVFDPDLERKVALKVLRGAGDSAEARQRLLREARAMARLAHPNVLTVHEVGSANGHDFIAMELVDGSTLEDWLAEPRSEREIIAAFTLAGRGLAAAHAAGLVHRDFKPRNVLRHKDGRIVVTDFGLVVGVAQQVDALMTTLPPDVSADSSTTPSSLSGLTQTGALLGTPAYMAPEQWSGGTVGPPADQFAFCVALWEALAKARPYKGTTLEELKEQVTHAKRSDEAKLPRTLRPILRRGLDPDPAKRYPSMDALLVALARAERRPIIPIAIAGAALAVVAIVAGMMMKSSTTQAPGPSTAACPAPVISVESFWSAHDREQMGAAHQPLVVKTLDHDIATWKDVRARACRAAPELRKGQIACLDGVLARMELLKTTIAVTPLPMVTEIATSLIDPKVCESPTPPRLYSTPSPQVRAVMLAIYKHVGSRVQITDDEATKLVADAAGEPCASAYAQASASQIRTGAAGNQLVANAEKDAQRCGDDRLIADIALLDASSSFVVGDPMLAPKIERAETFVEKVNQPDLQGTLEQIRGTLAAEAEHVDDAITRVEHAAQLFDERGAIRKATQLRIWVARIRWHRATPADLALVPKMVDEMRTKLVAAVGEHDDGVLMVEDVKADWLWRNGDVAGGDAIHAGHLIPVPTTKPVPAHGKVVDEAGAPVANATVTADQALGGDSVLAARPSVTHRTAKTDANGRFEIPDAESDSIAIAQAGAMRSAPVHITGPDVTLTLRPTSRVSGKVELRDRQASLVTVRVTPEPESADMNYVLDAPVLPDGTFVLDGVPRRKMRFSTVTSEGLTGERVTAKVIDVSTPTVENVQLEVKAGGKPISILVRALYSDEILTSTVFVMSGKFPSETTLGKAVTSLQSSNQLLATRLTPEQDSAPVHAKSKPGDLFVRAANRPEGVVTACAMPLPKYLDDKQVTEKLKKAETLEKIPLRCVPVDPKDDVIVISVPPWPRLD